MVRKNIPENKKTTITVGRKTRDRLKKLQEDEENFLDEILNLLLDFYEANKQETAEIVE